MKEKVLVTGGAGFVGSHLVDALIKEGYPVRVMDNLEPQVHGSLGQAPGYLNPEAEFFKGDLRSHEALKKALDGVEIVFHLGACVGVGQSMYEMEKYVEVNTLGTVRLLEALVNPSAKKVKKAIVASSMSIYGEGLYACPNCGHVHPSPRDDEQLKRRQWEMRCPHCQRELKPRPTPEEKPLHPTSIYAITKRDQEEMFLTVGKAYGLPVVALRYFNIYGPRQALNNPYTGVGAIFSSRLLNNKAPLIYEDGKQVRDFIHVKDITRANLFAMKSSKADYMAINIGTGRALSVLEVARLLSEKLGYQGQPEVVNQFRSGDIRHCYSDISKVRALLGFEPEVSFEQGLEDLINWVKAQLDQRRGDDGVEKARRELAQRGLTF